METQKNSDWTQEYLKKVNLKLKNQISQLDNLIRKKKCLDLDIARMRKLISLTRSKTKKTIKEGFPDIIQEKDNSLYFTSEFDQNLVNFDSEAAEFTSLEEDSEVLFQEIDSDFNSQLNNH